MVLAFESSLSISSLHVLLSASFLIVCFVLDCQLSQWGFYIGYLRDSRGKYLTFLMKVPLLTCKIRKKKIHIQTCTNHFGNVTLYCTLCVGTV